MIKNHIWELVSPQFVTLFLARYGEIGLKGRPVRRRFEKILSENILKAHSLASTSCVVKVQNGRIFVETEDRESTTEILRKTFGLVSFSEVEVVSSDPADIAEESISLMRKSMTGDQLTFAVRARRTGTHPYTSMELASIVGERIIKELGEDSVKVSLNCPNIEIFVEVRGKKAYLFRGLIRGTGGFPIRSQGRALSLIEDRKSLLATWMMMKRGCNVLLLNRSKLNEDDIEVLRSWNPWWPPVIQDGEKSLEELIELKSCTGLVLDWSLGDFEMKKRISPGVAVFYPLMGMSSDEIESRIVELQLA